MKMEENEVINTLQKRDLIHENDHFVLSSWRHSRRFVETGGLFFDPDLAYMYGYQITLQLSETGLMGQIQVVLGPESNGTVLAHEIGHRINQFRKGDKVLTCSAKKNPGGGFTLSKAAARMVKGKNVLLVDDTILSGGTFFQVRDAVIAAGGNVIAAAAVLNRGDVEAQDLNVYALLCLASMPLESWSEEECRESGPCSEGTPINTEYGLGQEFLDQKERLRSMTH